MAEHLLRQRLGTDRGWSVASAGVFAGYGGSASEDAIKALLEVGIDVSAHQSQPVTAELVHAADLILVMTGQHLADVLREYPDAEDRTHLITAFGDSDSPSEIPDPIGQSIDVYRWTRDQLAAAATDVVLHVKERWGLQDAPRNKEARSTMKVAIGNDHGGFEMKQALVPLLEERNLEVVDLGAHSLDSVDYPDFADAVAAQVSEGEVDEGILVCRTGIGMSITANRYPGVRAALVTTPHLARMARTHNNANVLTLGADEIGAEEAKAILEAWFDNQFEGGRHQRRVEKIETLSATTQSIGAVYRADPEIYAVLKAEQERQEENLELIASENIASKAVREAAGSVLTNKYAEGYPGKRWYHGCEHVDEAERLAIARARELFGAEHANVQPHSGSQANMAAYFAVIEPGDTMLAMSLDHGGHLTHGHGVNFSGRLFNVVHYGVNRDTERIDYDEVEQLAGEHKPKMILAGASAYSRIIDFERLRAIADAVGAYLVVDMAHIAGLVAAGCHPNPVPFCDLVTTTTHKTLRGPRGGLVLCREQFAKDVDKQVFPGTQGGPFMHIIAAKAICFQEALQPGFTAYQQQVVANAAALAEAMVSEGFRICSGGTDNHVMLVDLNPVGVTGKDASAALDKARITANKNAIPFDTRSPFVTSGIRLGSPTVTTRNMKEPQMKEIAAAIGRVLKDLGNEDVVAEVREEVVQLTARFPMP